MKKRINMEKPKKAQTARRRRHKISLTKAVSWILLSVGAIALIASVIYASSILAFIGLGILFWGAILTYIKTEDYIKGTLLDASVLPSLVTLGQILQEFNYKGKPTYLPPKYFEDPETSKIYIAKQETSDLPPPDQIQKCENKFVIRDSQSILGILLTPPGAELAKLFEKTLETSLTKVDLKYLQQNMPKLFVEDLEIAENLEIETNYDKSSEKTTKLIFPKQTEYDRFHIKIVDPICKDLCKKAQKIPHICGSVGCPICSAIACALAKASGKLVAIEKTELIEDGEIIEVHYGIRK
jgi:hypothetical protein